MPELLTPSKSLQSQHLKIVAIGVFVFLTTTANFAFRLGSEPRFVDESAFLSQSYYLDLFLALDRQNPVWLEYPAYDLPPLPKYLFGGMLRLTGHHITSRTTAFAWYQNTKTVVGSTQALVAARWISVVLGGVGCVAAFALGSLAANVRVGLLTAALLMINPLYRMHARRAMADVPAEAFILATEAVGLWVWKRGTHPALDPVSWTPRAILAGTLAGLAVLAKLNGGLGLMVLLAWNCLGIVLSWRSRRRLLLLLGYSLLSGTAALVVFVAGNPTVTCQPNLPLPNWLVAPLPPTGSVATRLGQIIKHRVDVSRSGQEAFPNDALRSSSEKFKAFIVQGFGRFGPFGPGASDSTRRFEWRQDWGALVWTPLVLGGCTTCLRRGISQRAKGESPTGWAVVIAVATSYIVVGSFLPLAWDRYFLPIQAGSCLVAAIGIVTWTDGLVQGLRRA